MDSSRLMSILTDIEFEFKKNNIATIIGGLQNRDSDNFEVTARSIIRALENASKHNLMLEYGATDFKILNHIGGDQFFGEGLKQSVKIKPGETQ